MSQANNLGWVETDLDLEILYHQLLQQSLRADASTSVCLRPRQFHSLGVQFVSPVALASHAFDVAFDTVPSAKNIRKIFHIDKIDDSVLMPFTNDPGILSKPALGLFNPDTKETLILEKGEFNYGFMNAMVLGNFSALSNQILQTQFAHAACVDINGTGVLIIGDHKAGKSTLVSKLLSETQGRSDISLGMVSDDWVIIEQPDRDLSRIRALRVSDEYRIDEQTIQSPRLNLSPIFNQLVQHYKDPKSKKASIPIDELCERMGHRSLLDTDIKIIIVMDPTQSDYSLCADLDQAMDILSASTANVPPLGSLEKTEQENFWKKQFSSHPSVSINNRHPHVQIQDVVSDILKLAHR